MQYAFARVTDPNSGLLKFVQINWCGDGVPEARKGLFYSHSSAVANFLRGSHVVISARNESDVSPALIMSRVEAASGAKYSSHKETARKFEPITPVGTNYVPVGKPDMAAIRRTPGPSQPVVARSVPMAPSPAAGMGRAPVVNRSAAPDDAWDAPAPVSKPPPPPAAARPPVVSSIRPAASVPAPPPASNVPTKPDEEDRIGPVGTAYTPIKLAPKKLVNPFAAREPEQQTESVQSRSAAFGGSSTGGAKKLTWSERQALAKKQAEEEESRSRAASYKAPPAASTPRSFGGMPPRPPPAVAPEPEEEEEETYAPPATPSARTACCNSSDSAILCSNAAAATCL
ncbi:hypothetical protein EW026_g7035 [Hermanssonia centrifuga]|uniref:ADF-H domain-containing protein n=1 Tax=Hermanssonia centrifuga TaxID=98765 RepID=A0A4S4K949_9APHY|nr:hypothetical protein EW026_g7035 [Hermanssonia centrifuga]